MKKRILCVIVVLSMSIGLMGCYSSKDVDGLAETLIQMAGADTESSGLSEESVSTEGISEDKESTENNSEDTEDVDSKIDPEEWKTAYIGLIDVYKDMEYGGHIAEGFLIDLNEDDVPELLIYNIEKGGIYQYDGALHETEYPASNLEKFYFVNHRLIGINYGTEPIIFGATVSFIEMNGDSVQTETYHFRIQETDNKATVTYLDAEGNENPIDYDTAKEELEAKGVYLKTVDSDYGKVFYTEVQGRPGEINHNVEYEGKLADSIRNW